MRIVDVSPAFKDLSHLGKGHFVRFAQLSEIYTYMREESRIENHATGTHFEQ
jgi:hypothetical protein